MSPDGSRRFLAERAVRDAAFWDEVDRRAALEKLPPRPFDMNEEQLDAYGKILRAVVEAMPLPKWEDYRDR